MQFTADVQAGHLYATLRAINGTVKRPHALMGTIGATVLRLNQQRHDVGQAPDGSSWTPLAKSTVHAIVERRQHQITRVAGKRDGARSDFRAAQKIMAGKRILLDRGDLLRFYYRANGSEVIISTMDQRKAAWHHFGTGTHGPKGASYEIRPKAAKALAFGGLVRKRVMHPGVPARQLVGFPDSDRDVVSEVVSDHITHVAQQASSK
ncbi:phage virion morphogenesis protein [Rhodoferax sp. BLA1]|uniref:phage virion morphogenesis protein n=1 Tax=Rhodoferax sp. BLA1 TaxID=2576062 RepID=UPI0015D15FB6|nr:phage virion morphogenesis protein [Rhodoferax sp. BLA1]